MADAQSPHTNSARLVSYVGRTVRLWVKVLRFQGDAAIVQASDGGEVKIKYDVGQPNTLSDQFVEVVGKVEQPNFVVLLASTDLGPDFTDKDLENYNRMVEASENPKFRHLFQPS